MEMPKVLRCEIIDCAYNLDNVCHAMAISIGDGVRPTCNTFCQYLMEAKAGDVGCVAQVGACKESDCVHNVCLECQASGIVVGQKEDHPECETFKSAYIAEDIKNEVSSRKCDAGFSCTAPEVFIG